MGPPQIDLAIIRPIEITNDLPPFPPNQVSFETEVTNLSPSDFVFDVQVDFYNGDPDDGKELIDSIMIGEIEPGATRPVSANWRFNENIESGSLFARVTSESIADPNIENNTISVPLGIYFVA